jgi:hypothetical protein
MAHTALHDSFFEFGRPGSNSRYCRICTLTAGFRYFRDTGNFTGRYVAPGANYVTFLTQSGPAPDDCRRFEVAASRQLSG